MLRTRGSIQTVFPTIKCIAKQTINLKTNDNGIPGISDSIYIHHGDMVSKKCGRTSVVAMCHVCTKTRISGQTPHKNDFNVLDAYVRFFIDNKGLPRCEYAVFPSGEVFSPISKASVKIPQQVLDLNNPLNVVHVLKLDKCLLKHNFMIYHVASCVCHACRDEYGRPCNSELADLHLIPVTERPSSPSHIEYQSMELYLNQAAQAAGQGRSPMEVAVDAAGQVVGAVVDQVAGAAVAGVYDSVVETGRQAAQQLGEHAYGSGLQAVRHIRNYFTSTSDADGFTFSTFGSKSREQCARMEGGHILAASAPTNNTGGISYAEDVEEVDQVTTNWLTGGGTTVYNTNTGIPKSMLEFNQKDATLASFLCRPVEVGTYSYTHSVTPGTSTAYSPWGSVFASANIKDKLNHFRMFRANLNIKLVVTASPFLYGAVMFSYQPRGFAKSLPDTYGALVCRSQRRNLTVYPQTSAGGFLQVPFIYNRKMADVTSKTLIDELGTLRAIPLDILRNAMGTTPPAVNIRIYAWLSDVAIGGMTQREAYQSFSSEGTGKGNVRVIDEINVSASLANSNSYETNISHICRKESLLFYKDWLSTDAKDAFMFGILSQCGYSGSKTSDAPPFSAVTYYPTPAMYLGQTFRYWRGDMIVRFRILKTPFHRGRLTFVYEPAIGSLLPQPTVQKTRIVDIGLVDEFEITIPFGTTRSWLKTSAINESGFSVSSNNVSDYSDSEYVGGILKCFIDQPLTGPADPSQLRILAYVRAAPNFRLGGPMEVSSSLYYNNVWLAGDQSITSDGTSYGPTAYQSKEKTSGDFANMGTLKENLEMIHATGVDSPVDILDLVRRRELWLVMNNFTTSSNSAQSWFVTYLPFMPKVPRLLTNYSAERFNIVSTFGGITDFRCTTYNQTMLAFMSLMYIGYKGDLVNSFTLASGEFVYPVHRCRRTYSAYLEVAAERSADSQKSVKGASYGFAGGVAGAKTANGLSELEFERPFMGDTLFYYTEPFNVKGHGSEQYNGATYSILNLSNRLANAAVYETAFVHVQASDNFEFVEFLNCPPLVTASYGGFMPNAAF